MRSISQVSASDWLISPSLLIVVVDVVVCFLEQLN